MSLAPRPSPLPSARGEGAAAHRGEVGALERRPVDDHGLVGEQALGLEGRELGPRRERIAGTAVAVAHALSEVEDPCVVGAVGASRSAKLERAVPSSDEIGPTYAGAIRVVNPFCSTPWTSSPALFWSVVSPPRSAPASAYLSTSADRPRPIELFSTLSGFPISRSSSGGAVGDPSAPH